MLLAAMLLLSQMTLAQDATLAQFRAQVPQLSGLDDASTVRVIQQSFYPSVPLERIAEKLGVVMAPPKPMLGPIDKWRYESCQQDAATAPTSQGVAVKLRICRDKFGQ